MVGLWVHYWNSLVVLTLGLSQFGCCSSCSCAAYRYQLSVVMCVSQRWTSSPCRWSSKSLRTWLRTAATMVEAWGQTWTYRPLSVGHILIARIQLFIKHQFCHSWWVGVNHGWFLHGSPTKLTINSGWPRTAINMPFISEIGPFSSWPMGMSMKIDQHSVIAMVDTSPDAPLVWCMMYLQNWVIFYLDVHPQGS